MSEQLVLPGDDFSLLQRRYPMAHLNVEGERGYVLRDDMTEEDWLWNIAQLKDKMSGRAGHLEQLERWGEKVRGFKREGEKRTPEAPDE